MTTNSHTEEGEKVIVECICGGKMTEAMAKSDAQDFVDTIKDKPEEIIKWARKEIAAYEELIKILEKETND